jgi:hypothetical protein
LDAKSSIALKQIGLELQVVRFEAVSGEVLA